MPRSKTTVKNKLLKSWGLVDLHFHGAFGVDWMQADSLGSRDFSELNELSRLLWHHHLAGFCPTTLSSPPRELRQAVARLGHWIRSAQAPGAQPLGIHLEGPFIARNACGAHPSGSLRRATLAELESLWEASLGTLKILTIAPEIHRETELKGMARWCRLRGIRLSLGHSQATKEQASQAFDLGFQGVTHAWNALPFHHRSPGVLGAAFSRKKVYLELIVDGIHVAPEVIRWTLDLHQGPVCFISDGVPAAGLKEGKKASFGKRTVVRRGAVCRLSSGHLAGGGELLPVLFKRWVEQEAQALSLPLAPLLRRMIPAVTTAPLKALGLTPAAIQGRRLAWKVTELEVDSKTCLG